jgi:hypothetical protein
MKKLCCLVLVVFGLQHTATNAQNTRLTTSNQVGWYTYAGTFKLDKKWNIFTEYHWRRNQIISTWQQSLLRLSVNYQIDPKVQLRVGYTWAETFPYGDYSLNPMGKEFSEYRAFEAVTLTDKIGIVDLSHRFMLEQRWIGKYSVSTLTKEDVYTFSNRLRYQIRLQMPLKGKTIADKTPYLAAYDEVLIGFGNNVNENVFDQNRMGLLLGYKFNHTVKLEAGLFNQTVQFGREFNGRNLFQYNTGIVINSVFNFDFSKKEELKK